MTRYALGDWPKDSDQISLTLLPASASLEEVQATAHMVSDFITEMGIEKDPPKVFEIKELSAGTTEN